MRQARVAVRNKLESRVVKVVAFGVVQEGEVVLELVIVNGVAGDIGGGVVSDPIDDIGVGRGSSRRGAGERVVVGDGSS